MHFSLEVSLSWIFGTESESWHRGFQVFTGPTVIICGILLALEERTCPLASHSLCPGCCTVDSLRQGWEPWRAASAPSLSQLSHGPLWAEATFPLSVNYSAVTVPVQGQDS